MDDLFATNTGPPTAGDGAFERFLTAAIAAIITIMFSWRLLAQEENFVGGGEGEPRGAVGGAVGGEVPKVVPKVVMKKAIKMAKAAGYKEESEALEKEQGLRDEGKAGDSGVNTVTSPDLDTRPLITCWEKNPSAESDSSDIDVAIDREQFDNLGSYLNQGVNGFSRGSPDYGDMLAEEEEGYQPFNNDPVFGDDVQPRELDSDEEMYYGNMLETIMEEDSDDMCSTSTGSSDNSSVGRTAEFAYFDLNEGEEGEYVQAEGGCTVHVMGDDEPEIITSVITLSSSAKRSEKLTEKRSSPELTIITETISDDSDEAIREGGNVSSDIPDDSTSDGSDESVITVVTRKSSSESGSPVRTSQFGFFDSGQIEIVPVRTRSADERVPVTQGMQQSTFHALRPDEAYPADNQREVNAVASGQEALGQPFVTETNVDTVRTNVDIVRENVNIVRDARDISEGDVDMLVQQTQNSGASLDSGVFSIPITRETESANIIHDDGKVDINSNVDTNEGAKVSSASFDGHSQEGVVSDSGVSDSENASGDKQLNIVFDQSENVPDYKDAVVSSAVEKTPKGFIFSRFEIQTTDYKEKTFTTDRSTHSVVAKLIAEEKFVPHEQTDAEIRQKFAELDDGAKIKTTPETFAKAGSMDSEYDYQTVRTAVQPSSDSATLSKEISEGLVKRIHPTAGPGRSPPEKYLRMDKTDGSKSLRIVPVKKELSVADRLLNIDTSKLQSISKRDPGSLPKRIASVKGESPPEKVLRIGNSKSHDIEHETDRIQEFVTETRQTFGDSKETCIDDVIPPVSKETCIDDVIPHASKETSIDDVMPQLSTQPNTVIDKRPSKETSVDDIPMPKAGGRVQIDTRTPSRVYVPDTKGKVKTNKSKETCIDDIVPAANTPTKPSSNTKAAKTTQKSKSKETCIDDVIMPESSQNVATSKETVIDDVVTKVKETLIDDPPHQTKAYPSSPVRRIPSKETLIDDIPSLHGKEPLIDDVPRGSVQKKPSSESKTKESVIDDRSVTTNIKTLSSSIESGTVVKPPIKSQQHETNIDEPDAMETDLDDVPQRLLSINRENIQRFRDRASLNRDGSCDDSTGNELDRSFGDVTTKSDESPEATNSKDNIDRNEDEDEDEEAWTVDEVVQEFTLKTDPDGVTTYIPGKVEHRVFKTASDHQSSASETPKQSPQQSAESSPEHRLMHRDEGKPMPTPKPRRSIKSEDMSSTEEPQKGPRINIQSDGKLTLAEIGETSWRPMSDSDIAESSSPVSPKQFVMDDVILSGSHLIPRPRRQAYSEADKSDPRVAIDNNEMGSYGTRADLAHLSSDIETDAEIDFDTFVGGVGVAVLANQAARPLSESSPKQELPDLVDGNESPDESGFPSLDVRRTILEQFKRSKSVEHLRQQSLEMEDPVFSPTFKDKSPDTTESPVVMTSAVSPPIIPDSPIVSPPSKAMLVSKKGSKSVPNLAGIDDSTQLHAPFTHTTDVRSSSPAKQRSRQSPAQTSQLQKRPSRYTKKTSAAGSAPVVQASPVIKAAAKTNRQSIHTNIDDVPDAPVSEVSPVIKAAPKINRQSIQTNIDDVLDAPAAETSPVIRAAPKVNRQSIQTNIDDVSPVIKAVPKINRQSIQTNIDDVLDAPVPEVSPVIKAAPQINRQSIQTNIDDVTDAPVVPASPVVKGAPTGNRQSIQTNIDDPVIPSSPRVAATTRPNRETNIDDAFDSPVSTERAQGRHIRQSTGSKQKVETSFGAEIESSPLISPSPTMKMAPSPVLQQSPVVKPPSQVSTSMKPLIVPDAAPVVMKPQQKRQARTKRPSEAPPRIPDSANVTPTIQSSPTISGPVIQQSPSLKGPDLIKDSPVIAGPPQIQESPSMSGPPIPQSPSMSGPPIPQSPSMSGPPIPQSPSMSGPPIPQSPSMSGPPIPQSPTMSGPPILQSPTMTGPPILQSPTMSGPPIPQSPTMSGPPIPDSPSLSMSPDIPTSPSVSIPDYPSDGMDDSSLDDSSFRIQKKYKSMKELKRKYSKSFQSLQMPPTPNIGKFVVPAQAILTARSKINAQRKRFLSEENLISDNMSDQFKEHKDSLANTTKYKSPRRPDQKRPSSASSQDTYDAIALLYPNFFLDESSDYRPSLDELHKNCILTPEGRQDILNRTRSIENLTLDLRTHLKRFGSVTSLVETDIDTGETSETQPFPETDLDLWFSLQDPIDKAVSMSDLRSEHRTGKGRFANRNVPKSKSLQTLETNLDDEDDDDLKRTPSVHELRITKSLSKLNIPDWFKSSNLSKSGSCILRHGSTSTMSSWGFNPSITSSPCPSVTTQGGNVVIKTRVSPSSSMRFLKSPKYSSVPTLPKTPEERTVPKVPCKLPSEKFRKGEKPKVLEKIPIVPFAQIKAMFESKAANQRAAKKASSRQDSVNSRVSEMSVPVVTLSTSESPSEIVQLEGSPRTRPKSPPVKPESGVPKARTFSPLVTSTHQPQNSMSPTSKSPPQSPFDHVDSSSPRRPLSPLQTAPLQRSTSPAVSTSPTRPLSPAESNSPRSLSPLGSLNSSAEGSRSFSPSDRMRPINPDGPHNRSFSPVGSVGSPRSISPRGELSPRGLNSSGSHSSPESPSSPEAPSEPKPVKKPRGILGPTVRFEEKETLEIRDNKPATKPGKKPDFFKRLQVFQRGSASEKDKKNKKDEPTSPPKQKSAFSPFSRKENSNANSNSNSRSVESAPVVQAPSSAPKSPSTKGPVSPTIEEAPVIRAPPTQTVNAPSYSKYKETVGMDSSYRANAPSGDVYRRPEVTNDRNSHPPREDMRPDIKQESRASPVRVGNSGQSQTPSVLTATPFSRNSTSEAAKRNPKGKKQQYSENDDELNSNDVQNICSTFLLDQHSGPETMKEDLLHSTGSDVRWNDVIRNDVTEALEKASVEDVLDGFLSFGNRPTKNRPNLNTVSFERNGHAIPPSAGLDKGSNVESRSGEKDVDVSSVKCGNPMCANSIDIRDVPTTYKLCPFCFTYYCGRLCRKANSEAHRLQCHHSKVNSACRHVITKINKDPQIQYAYSRIATLEYQERGRGCLTLHIPDLYTAERFMYNDCTNVNTVFVPVCELTNSVLGSILNNVKDMCDTYNPSLTYVMHVSIGTSCGLEQIPRPRSSDSVIQKCAKLRLSPAQDLISDENCHVTLLIASGERTHDFRSPREAREASFLSIQRKLRDRGINLRHEFPNIYNKLIDFVADGRTFSPEVIHPVDATSGDRFPCVIMIEPQSEIEWMQAQDMPIDVDLPLMSL